MPPCSSTQPSKPRPVHRTTSPGFRAWAQCHSKNIGTKQNEQTKYTNENMNKDEQSILIETNVYSTNNFSILQYTLARHSRQFGCSAWTLERQVCLNSIQLEVLDSMKEGKLVVEPLRARDRGSRMNKGKCSAPTFRTKTIGAKTTSYASCTTSDGWFASSSHPCAGSRKC